MVDPCGDTAVRLRLQLRGRAKCPFSTAAPPTRSCGGEGTPAASSATAVAGIAQTELGG